MCTSEAVHNIVTVAFADFSVGITLIQKNNFYTPFPVTHKLTFFLKLFFHSGRKPPLPIIPFEAIIHTSSKYLQNLL